MESDQDVERIQLAIQKLMMEETQREKDGTVDDEKQLLEKLLCQLGSEEARNSISKETSVSRRDEGEEIAKELKAVKNQNRITHCLLSALIVITLGWQLSEVSIILKVKDRLSNPFSSLAQMLLGPFNASLPNGNGGDRHNSQNNQQQKHSQPLIEIPFTSHSADS